MFIFLRTYTILLFIACGISHAATIATLDGIVISEILPDPNTSSGGFDTDGDGTSESNDEFVEFYNPFSTTVDISGWEIYNSNGSTFQLAHTFAASTSLGFNEAIVVARTVSPGAPAGIIEASIFSSFSLANGADSIALYNPNTQEFVGAVYNGATFSALGLPSGATQVGNITDFGNDTDGQSLALSPQGEPIINSTPTPGTSSYVPEPSSLFLLSLASVALFKRRRP